MVRWSRRPQVLKGGKQEGLYLLKNSPLEGLGGAEDPKFYCFFAVSKSVSPGL